MERKISYICLMLCLFVPKIWAQVPPESDLVFTKLVHDFGDILLSDGKKSCTFNYTNKGSRPIVIQQVLTSCGCTDPKWDKAPVMPGKSGQISVTFSNDQGPYPFEKTLTVYSTATDLPIILKIKGIVHEKKKSLSELFPVAYSSFRLRNSQYHLGQIAQGEHKTDSAQVVNTGKSAIEVGFTKISKGLIISVYPKKLKPGEIGYLRYTVDTRIHTDWGTVTYSAQPCINGKPEGTAPIEIAAEIRDNFKNYTKEELANAPILLAEQTWTSFDQAKRGSKIEKSFTISNRGRTPLVIHKAIPQDGVTVKAPTAIAPGKSETIAVGIDTSNMIGEIVAVVTLITNVPSRPIMSLSVTGTVTP
ncbi:MAG: DUF1573 domain-containing protein [Bacteroidetes bacterium]|nr:DUF1573 domain-containing protein [Bacteroidota bacterium]